MRVRPYPSKLVGYTFYKLRMQEFLFEAIYFNSDANWTWNIHKVFIPANLVLYVPDHTILHTQIYLVDGSPEPSHNFMMRKTLTSKSNLEFEQPNHKSR